MDEKAFKSIYHESRNGANFFVRHPLVRSFQYTDGVQALAETGCYWLLDILATECPRAMRKAGEPRCIVTARVANGKANLSLSYKDGTPPLWKRHINSTDLPDGEWAFELVDEGERFALCLISEH